MSIVNASAPKGGLKAVSRGVARSLRTPSGPASVLFKVSKTTELSVADPHPTYVVDLADLVAGRLLSAARQTGWRFLLIDGTRAVGEVETGLVSAKGGAPKVIGLTIGPFASATLAALHTAEQLPAVKRASYELRHLRAPAVYLAAIWLHGNRDDLLFALHHPPAGLKEHRAYTEAHVLRVLKREAMRVLKLHATLARTKP